jgi:phage repressor protein C with HTH and peptisase S24 domain
LSTVKIPRDKRFFYLKLGLSNVKGFFRVLNGVIARIERRLEALNMSASAASAKAGLTRDAIRNIRRACEGGRSDGGFNTKTLAALAITLGTTTAWLLDGNGPEVAIVPIIGDVGTDGVIKIYKAGELQMAEAPPYAKEGTRALLVKGNAMFPAMEAGTIIYYSDHLDPVECLNRRCVVQVLGGEMYVKILRASRLVGMFNLQNLNPTYPDTENVIVQWAAKIDWIKPAG